MPTDKPKQTLMFSNELSKDLLNAALKDRAIINGTSRSWEIEQILKSTLLPQGNGFANQAMARIYSGKSSVQNEIRVLLEDASAITDPEEERYDIRPLVMFASSQSFGLSVNVSDRKQGSNQLFDELKLLAGCLDEVALQVSYVNNEEYWANVSEEDFDADELGETYDERIIRSAVQTIGLGWNGFESKTVIDAILRNWGRFRDHSHPCLSVAYLVKLTDGWPETPQSREGLKACLKAIEAQVKAS